jgi:hypothetical protein
MCYEITCFFAHYNTEISGVDITDKRIFSANKTVSAPLGVPSRLPGEMLLLFISLDPSRLPVFFLFFHRKER